MDDQKQTQVSGDQNTNQNALNDTTTSTGDTSEVKKPTKPVIEEPSLEDTIKTNDTGGDDEESYMPDTPEE